MEKESELYLIKRIKDLESENAYLKGKIKDYEDRDDIDQEIIDENGCLSIHEKLNEDMQKVVRKAEAFDYLQDLLGLAVCNWVEQKTYELYSNKTSKDLHIKLPISQEYFVKLWGLFNGN